MPDERTKPTPEEEQPPGGTGPSLQIYYEEGGLSTAPNWRIQVANSDEFFTFMGETAQEQTLRIQRLGQLMQEYNADPAMLIDELPVLIDWPPGPTSEQMVQALFGETTSLVYEDETIFAVAAADDVLIDAMVAAGEALLAALAL